MSTNCYVCMYVCMFSGFYSGRMGAGEQVNSENITIDIDVT